VSNDPAGAMYNCCVMKCNWQSEHCVAAGFELWQQANRSACQDVWNLLRGRHPNRRLARNSRRSSGWSTLCSGGQSLRHNKHIAGANIRTCSGYRQQSVCAPSRLFVSVSRAKQPNSSSNSFVKQQTVENRVKISLWLII